MDSVEDLNGLVYSELQDTLAAVRPPESPQYTRNLPDPLVVDFLVQNVVLPILTGIVGGILTYWVTSRDDKKNVEEIKAQLHSLRATLEKISKTEQFDSNVQNEFQQTATTILLMRSQIVSPIHFDVQLTETRIAEELKRFHIGSQTARLKAAGIVKRVRESVESRR